MSSSRKRPPFSEGLAEDARALGAVAYAVVTCPKCRGAGSPAPTRMVCGSCKGGGLVRVDPELVPVLDVCRGSAC